MSMEIKVNQNESFQKLGRDNFLIWKFRAKTTLISLDLWEAVEPAAGEDVKVDDKIKAKAMAKIASWVDDDNARKIYHLSDPKDAWDKLQALHEPKDTSHKVNLIGQLFTTKMKVGQDVGDFIQSIKELWSKLQMNGNEEFKIPEIFLIAAVLNGLPKEFDAVVQAMKNLDESKLSWTAIEERLISEFNLIKNAGDLAEDEKALAVQEKQQKNFKQVECFYCKKRGHFKKDCRKRKADLQKNQVNIGQEHCLMATEQWTRDWIVDSGASRHMTGELSLLKNVRKTETLTIYLANNKAVKSKLKGEVQLECVVQGKIKNCKVRDVYYIPEFKKNLLSVSQLTAAGANVQFNQEGCKIMINKELIAVGKQQSRVYLLESSTESVNVACESEFMLAHKRLGHCGIAPLLELVKSGDLSKPTDSEKQRVKNCETCAQAKMKRVSYKPSESSSNEVGDLIHSDICGKIKQSIGGSQYFITFIDDYSKHVQAYSLKTKDEALDYFQKYVSWLKARTGKDVRSIRSDNGAEYKSKQFQKFCQNKNITQQFSTTYTPQQNGVAERMNQTLLNTIRALLAESRLSKEFWAEALQTAVHTRNILPLVSNKNLLSSHELLTKRKPKIHYLRVFGASVILKVPDQLRTKLDPKGVKGTFLGYTAGKKGYRILLESNDKVATSRDVKFIEESRPPQGQTNNELEIQTVITNNSSNSTVETTQEEDVFESYETASETEEVTRPIRQTRKPQWMDDFVDLALIGIIANPTSYNEAVTCNDSKEWKNAMDSEMKSLCKNDTWDLVNLPEGRKAIKCKWVYRLKTDKDGKPIKFKARLVAKGYSQKEGIDYKETFSPVAGIASIRIILGYAVSKDYHIHQMDVATAFLNGQVEEELYMEQPKGYITDENKVCKLKRSLYGLKQAPRQWNILLDNYLKEMGLFKSKVEDCIYYNEKSSIILVVYVDDLIICTKTEIEMQNTKANLMNRFEMSDLGDLSFFLGIQISRNQQLRELSLCQKQYINELCSRFRMEDAKDALTPMNLDKENSDNLIITNKPYRELLGGLMYVAVCTRPDIAHSVSYLARFADCYTTAHWINLKRVLRYLKGTSNLSLKLGGVTNGTSITAYSDADFASKTTNRKSTSGFIIYLNNGPVVWKSQTQKNVTTSTTESEYVSMSLCTNEVIWIVNLLKSIQVRDLKQPILKGDNQSSITIANSTKSNSRIKHVDIRFHHIKEKVAQNEIKIEYCKSDDNIADILTKSLGTLKHENLRTQMMISFRRGVRIETEHKCNATQESCVLAQCV